MGKYEEALERAKQGLPIDEVFPELKESEDERIRKMLVEQMKRWKKCAEDNNVEQDVKDASAAIAYLEKQKEQKPVISDEAIREGVAHFGITQYQIDYWLKKHINVVDQKPVECIEDSVKFKEGFNAGRESGLRDGQKYVLDNLDSYGLCKPAEWSEEDLQHKSWILECLADGEKKMPEYAEDFQAAYKWLKSLRYKPHWKPSEEQMEALKLIVSNKKHYAPVLHEIALDTLYNDLKKL
jgi:hypothetical protein